MEPTPQLPILERDPELLPYATQLRRRLERFHTSRQQLVERYGSWETATTGHHYFGFNRGVREGKAGIWYREWAPGADAVFLMGEFNQWSRDDTPLSVDETGIWQVFLPDLETGPQLTAGTLVKVHLIRNGTGMDRIPAYSLQVRKVDDKDYSGVVAFQEEFDWKYPVPPAQSAPRIYEAHVGMAQEKEGVGTFDEFRRHILPRIKKQGYTCIQLMGLQQHPYYGSFGYHVSSFFAVSDYFGSPRELKCLIDAAHGMGLRVFMDIVHSHSVKNVREGLNMFDGTDHLYFHPGDRGNHPGWDSKVFNYGRPEVVRFLLSNIRYWLETFRIDGFRFDGISSMVYLDHGFMRSFDGYDDYFDDKALDHDGIAYLQLANTLIKDIAPGAVSIAEDVSGMPGMALPVEEGGIGFDYRLAMGLPDLWKNHIEHLRDEHWDLGYIADELTRFRPNEKTIAYCECHDQSIVGDQPLAFQLMGESMYTNMAISAQDPQIKRGMGLLNLIRLTTFFCGGEGWLNFIGNEFGHPEWVDFPREENEFSFERACRKWSLVDSPFLNYHFLANFDAVLNLLDDHIGLLNSPPCRAILVDNARRILAFERERCLLVVNFHHSESLKDFEISGCPPGRYRLDMHTDSYEFGGQSRLKTGTIVNTTLTDRRSSLRLDLPSRCGLCLVPAGMPELSHPYADEYTDKG